MKSALLSMLLEAETRRLLSVMEQAAIPGLLLKGQAIAQWAYPDPSLRASGDIDVLVATREAADLLARRLCESGYELFQPSGDLVGAGDDAAPRGGAGRVGGDRSSLPRDQFPPVQRSASRLTS